MRGICQESNKIRKPIRHCDPICFPLITVHAGINSSAYFPAAQAADLASRVVDHGTTLDSFGSRKVLRNCTSGVLDQLSQSDWASTRLDVSSFRENAYSMTATEKAGTPVDGVALGRIKPLLRNCIRKHSRDALRPGLPDPPSGAIRRRDPQQVFAAARPRKRVRSRLNYILANAFHFLCGNLGETCDPSLIASDSIARTNRRPGL